MNSSSETTVTPTPKPVTPSPTTRSAFVVIIPLIVVGTLLTLFAGGLVYAYTQQQAYPDRIYPGVQIGNINVGGLRPDEAHARVTSQIAKDFSEGLSFIVASTTLTLPSDQLAQVVSYNTEEALTQAYAIGHERKGLTSLFQILGLRIHQKTIPLSVNAFNRQLVEEWLSTSAAELLPKAQDAYLRIAPETSSSTEISIQPEVAGLTADLMPVITELDLQANQRNFHTITVYTLVQEPRIKTTDLAPLQTEAMTWLARAPITLTFEAKKFVATQAMIAPWLTATGTESLRLAIDEDRLARDLTPWLSSELRLAKAGNLTVENGALKDFIAPEEGVSINTPASAAAVEAVLTQASSTAPITLARETPQISGESAAELGIREVIGTGNSTFAGSPANRRKNIAIGADHVNGTLIAPEGEFSLLKVLGPIDGAHNWLPELVIKGNKTVPEFGGGLCQIGTTVFRGAMDSGLVITERRNHSYRVAYYEPAGTDATIYEPAPDFRFKNDTGKWVLITSRLVGDSVTFTFWGTKDGRTVAPRKPVITNIVAPPAKKMIPTTTLPVGKVKCTESAHAGATARLDYVVTYPTGEAKKTVFSSYYKPWGAVCLIGVETLTPGAPTVDETGINNPN